MEPNVSSSKPIATVFVTWIGLLILWTIFVGRFDGQELFAGAIVSAFVAFLAAGSGKLTCRACFSPRRLLFLFGFLLYLTAAIFKANLQMAAIVSRPKLSIRPGIVRIKTRLQSPIGRLILANAITLTPGTLTVDAQGEDLFIHWVNVDTDDAETATREIAAGFEHYLEVIFG